MKVGTLELDLLLDRTNFDRTIREAERDAALFSNTKVMMSPEIDSRGIKAIGGKVKTEVANINRWLTANPITPQVDLSQFERVHQLMEMSSGTLRIEVENKKADKGNQDCCDNLEIAIATNTAPVTELLKEIADNTKKKGLVSRVAGTVAQGAILGTTEAATRSFGEGISKGLERYFKTDFGRRGQALGLGTGRNVRRAGQIADVASRELLGMPNGLKDIQRLATNPAQKAFNNLADPRFYREIEDLIVAFGQSNSGSGNADEQKINQQLFDKARDKIQSRFIAQVEEDVTRVLGAMLTLGSHPLRIRKRIKLGESAQQARAQEELFRSEYEAAGIKQQIDQADSILHFVGGTAPNESKPGAPAVGTTHTMAAAMQAIFPNAFVDTITPYNTVDTEQIKEGIYHQLVRENILPWLQENKELATSVMGDEAYNNVVNNIGQLHPIDGIIQQNIDRGYNPDSVRLATKALASAQAFPEKDITLASGSGGGFIVEEAIAILNELAKRYPELQEAVARIKGFAIGTPISGLTQTSRTGDESLDLAKFQAYIGTLDHVGKGFFGSSLYEGLDPNSKKFLKLEGELGLPGGTLNPNLNLQTVIEDWGFEHKIGDMIADLGKPISKFMILLADFLNGNNQLNDNDAQEILEVFNQAKDLKLGESLDDYVSEVSDIVKAIGKVNEKLGGQINVDPLKELSAKLKRLPELDQETASKIPDILTGTLTDGLGINQVPGLGTRNNPGKQALAAVKSTELIKDIINQIAKARGATAIFPEAEFDALDPNIADRETIEQKLGQSALELNLPVGNSGSLVQLWRKRKPGEAPVRAYGEELQGIWEQVLVEVQKIVELDPNQEDRLFAEDGSLKQYNLLWDAAGISALYNQPTYAEQRQQYDQKTYDTPLEKQYEKALLAFFQLYEKEAEIYKREYLEPILAEKVAYESGDETAATRLQDILQTSKFSNVADIAKRAKNATNKGIARKQVLGSGTDYERYNQFVKSFMAAISEYEAGNRQNPEIFQDVAKKGFGINPQLDYLLAQATTGTGRIPDSIKAEDINPESTIALPHAQSVIEGIYRDLIEQGAIELENAAGNVELQNLDIEAVYLALQNIIDSIEIREDLPELESPAPLTPRKAVDQDNNFKYTPSLESEQNPFLEAANVPDSISSEVSNPLVPLHQTTNDKLDNIINLLMGNPMGDPVSLPEINIPEEVGELIKVNHDSNTGLDQKEAEYQNKSLTADSPEITAELETMKLNQALEQLEQSTAATAEKLKKLFSVEGLRRLAPMTGVPITTLAGEKPIKSGKKDDIAKAIARLSSDADIETAIANASPQMFLKQFQDMGKIKPEVDLEAFENLKRYWHDAINEISSTPLDVLDTEEAIANLERFAQGYVKLLNERELTGKQRQSTGSLHGQADELKSALQAFSKFQDIEELSKKFQEGASKAGKHWGRTTADILKNFRILAAEAKDKGYDIQRFISEGSPGTTQRIRQHWSRTEDSVTDNLQVIERQAQKVGSEMEEDLSLSPFVVVDGKNIASILENGYQSGFRETEFGRQNKLSVRSEYENSIRPEYADPETPALYGMVMPTGADDLSYVKGALGYGGQNPYLMRFNNSILEKSTLTVGDSLTKQLPNYEATPQNARKMLEEVGRIGESYLELQYWGNERSALVIDEIISLKSTPSAETQEAALEHFIPMRWQERDFETFGFKEVNNHEELRKLRFASQNPLGELERKFGIGAENSQKHWARTAREILKQFERLAIAAKDKGYDIQRFISEGSPGPSQRTRANWSKTAKHLKQQFDYIREQAKIPGSAIERMLTANPDMLTTLDAMESKLNQFTDSLANDYKLDIALEDENIAEQVEKDFQAIAHNLEDIEVGQTFTFDTATATAGFTQLEDSLNHIHQNSLDTRYLWQRIAEIAQNWARSMQGGEDPLGGLEEAYDVYASAIDNLPDVGDIFSGVSDFIDEMSEASPVFEQIVGFVKDLGISALGILGFSELSDVISESIVEIIDYGREFQRFERSMTAAGKNAADVFDELYERSQKYGTSLVQSMDGYTQLTLGVQGTQNQGLVDEIFPGFQKAFASRQSTAQQQGRGFLAVEQMLSKGNAAAEELRCYDKYTSVLTDQGWILWINVKGHHRFLTRNIKTGQLSYQKSSEQVKIYHSGKMLRVKTDDVDLLVTSEHRMIVRRPEEEEYEIIRAKNLADSDYYYLLNEHGSQEALVKRESAKWIDFEGYVYCATVPDSTLFVRRNGKSSWSGNSQLSEALPGAFAIATQSMAMDMQEFTVRLYTAQIAAQDLLTRMAAFYEVDSQILLEIASDSFEAELNRLINNLDLLKTKGGETIIPVLTPGLEVANAFMSLLANNLEIVSLVGGGIFLGVLGQVTKSMWNVATATKVNTLLIKTMGIEYATQTAKMAGAVGNLNRVALGGAKLAGKMWAAFAVPTAIVAGMSLLFKTITAGVAEMKAGEKVAKDLRKLAEENTNDPQTKTNQFAIPTGLNGQDLRDALKQRDNKIDLGNAFNFQESFDYLNQSVSLSRLPKRLENEEVTIGLIGDRTKDLDLPQLSQDLKEVDAELLKLKAERLVLIENSEFDKLAELDQEIASLTGDKTKIIKSVSFDLSLAKKALKNLETAEEFVTEKLNKSIITEAAYNRLVGIIEELKAKAQGSIDSIETSMESLTSNIAADFANFAEDLDNFQWALDGQIKQESIANMKAKLAGELSQIDLETLEVKANAVKANSTAQRLQEEADLQKTRILDPQDSYLQDAAIARLQLNPEISLSEQFGDISNMSEQFISDMAKELEETDKNLADYLMALASWTKAADDAATASEEAAKANLDYASKVKDNAASYRDFGISLRDLSRSIEDIQIERQRFAEDFPLQLEQAQRQISRAARDIAEQYDDFIRDLERQLVQVQIDLAQLDKQIFDNNIDIALLKQFRPGSSGFGRDIAQLYADYFKAVETEDTIKLESELSRLDLEQQTLENSRRIRDLAEQRVDQERDRLEQMRNLAREQEDFNRQQRHTWEDTLEQMYGIELQAGELGVSLDDIGGAVTNQGNGLIAALNDLANSIILKSQQLRETAATSDLTPASDVSSGDRFNRAAKILRQEEGFRTKAYWDVNAWRVGYGTAFDRNQNNAYNQNSTISRVGAEIQLTQYDLPRFEQGIISQVGKQYWTALNENVQAALLSVVYNRGSLTSTLVKAVQDGNKHRIAAAIRSTDYATHADRRRREAALAISEVNITPKTQPIPASKLVMSEPEQIMTNLGNVPQYGQRPQLNTANYGLSDKETQIEKSVSELYEAEKQKSAKTEELNNQQQAIALLNLINGLGEKQQEMAGYFRNLRREAEDRKYEIEQLNANAKGYLTDSEQIRFAGGDTRRDYQGRIRNLEDEQLELMNQIQNLEDLITPGGFLDQAAKEGNEDAINTIAQAKQNIEVLVDDFITKNKIQRQLRVEILPAVEIAETNKALELDFQRRAEELGLESDLISERKKLAPSFIHELTFNDDLRRIGEAEIKLDYERQLKDLDQYRESLDKTGDAYDRMKASLDELNQAKLDNLAKETNSLVQIFDEVAQPALNGLLDDFISRSVSAEDAWRNFAQSILTSLADILMSFAKNELLKVLFGGSETQFKGVDISGKTQQKGGIDFSDVVNVGSSLIQPKPGATVANPQGGGGWQNALAFAGNVTSLFFSEGGDTEVMYIPYGSHGLDTSDSALVRGIKEAMIREAHPQAFPAVLHKGEVVLSDLTGDAQLVRELRRSGRWNQMKAEGYQQTKVENFRYGSEGAAAIVRGNGGGTTIIQNTPITVHAKDVDSFKATEDQIYRKQRLMHERSKR